jgi:flagellar basal-body rod modification protein FlgD
MATVQSAAAASDLFSSINAANAKSSTTTTASSTQEAQDRFLKLLVTQLKNQDPLNPMDNAQMTTQLAQINTVSGIEKLNTTLGTLVDSFSSSQAIQSAGMIGKNVLVAGSQLALSQGQAVGGVKLAGAADQVNLSILDSSGRVLQSQNLGAREAGTFDFVWDGKTDAGATMPDGAYKFAVTATQGSAKVSADTLQVGTVSALVRANSGFLLDLGALGTVDFKNVQQIL